MCMVSMISDHYRDPYRDTSPLQPPQPFISPFPQTPLAPPLQWPPAAPPSLPWDRQAFDELKEIIRRLDALDKKLGLEHCEDPKKAEWMQQIEERLARLEDAAK